MKLVKDPGKWVPLIVALALPGSSLAAGNDPEWWHGHGHGGGGVADVGHPGELGKVSRTIALSVSDSALFVPSTITVKKGETVRFVVKNMGKKSHQLVLGTASQLAELYHSQMQAPGKQLRIPNAITVGVGDSAELIWTFTRSGTTSFGCLLPGHYDAGEKGTIIVQ